MHNGPRCIIRGWEADMLHLMPNSKGKTEQYYFVVEPLILFITMSLFLGQITVPSFDSISTYFSCLKESN